MAEIFDTLLLLALPASGKSEVRAFLTSKNPDIFHMGPTIQLDDYPYVHFQLLVDEALLELGQPRIYHSEDDQGGRNGPFIDAFDWPALIELINEDYAEILAGKAENPTHAAKRLFERLDCRDYARFDFRTAANGEIKLLDVNPNPGWCWDGKLNLMASFDGLSYTDLLRMIIETAQARLSAHRR